MIYTLATSAQEWLLDWQALETQRRRIAETLRLRDLPAPSIDENESSSAANGTPVTAESFLAWKQKFDAENRGASCQFGKNLSFASEKTGRQLFEADKSLVCSDLKSSVDLDEEIFDPSLYTLEIEDDSHDDNDDHTDEIVNQL